MSLALSVSEEEAYSLAGESLISGKAFEKMKQWVSGQGGDEKALSDTSLLSVSSCLYTVLAPKSGYLFSMNSEEIGLCAGDLGAGRKTKDDVIDPGAGIVLLKQRGEYVEKGESLAQFYASDPALFPSAEERFLKAVTFSEQKPEKQKLIYDIIL